MENGWLRREMHMTEGPVRLGRCTIYHDAESQYQKSSIHACHLRCLHP